MGLTAKDGSVRVARGSNEEKTTFELQDEAFPVRKTIARSELASRIAQGETLILHRRRIYKLDSWLERHPGGALPILHFVGRDATDELEAYHSALTLHRMRSFCIAMLDERDWRGGQGEEGYKPLTPPVQLGYRSGKLDHPDAQWSTWKVNGEEPDSSSKMPKARPSGFPLPVQLLEPPAPPFKIKPEREKAISDDYKRMHQRIIDAGLYDHGTKGYVHECIRYSVLSSMAFVCWYHSWYITSSIFLGMFWHQLTFTAHDAGHTGITHNYLADRMIGSIIADFVGGLSIGWWCDNHDIHHIVTNHPEHDPDIQHMPFFAISPDFLVRASPSGKKEGQVGLWSSYYRRVIAFDAPSRLLLKIQHRLYYVVMSLARFNLYANSYAFLALRARRDKWFFIETSGLAFFWYWFGYLYLGSMPSWQIRLAALLVSHIVTSPLHSQIALSHFAQSTEDLGLYECFASRQLRTTMDVLCPSYLDFFHGGLHMQVSHHLFPRLPRHRLREARDQFVRPFAQRWGLNYEEYTFGVGSGRVLKTLEHVANQVKILSLVADAQARGELHD